MQIQAFSGFISILMKIRRIGTELAALKAQVLRSQVRNARAWEIRFQHPPPENILRLFALSGLEMSLGQCVQMVNARLQLHRLQCQLQSPLRLALTTIPNRQVTPRQVVECQRMVGSDKATASFRWLPFHNPKKSRPSQRPIQISLSRENR